MKFFASVLFSAFLFLNTFKSQSQNIPVVSDVLTNVFPIQTDTLKGASFVIQKNNRQFLVTARHLFKKALKNGQQVGIGLFKQNKLELLRANIFIDKDTTVDVVVLTLNKQLIEIVPLQLGGQIMVGQDLYFLGFPSFGGNNFISFDSSFGALPLVKRATFAGMINQKGYTRLFLDGHNNPGFSGGPIIAYDYFAKKNIICGIISGYFYEEKNLMNDAVIYKEFIKENSGIIDAVHIKVVNDIIDENFK